MIIEVAYEARSLIGYVGRVKYLTIYCVFYAASYTIVILGSKISVHLLSYEVDILGVFTSAKV